MCKPLISLQYNTTIAAMLNGGGREAVDDSIDNASLREQSDHPVSMHRASMVQTGGVSQ